MPRFFRFLILATLPALLCACGGSPPEQAKEAAQPPRHGHENAQAVSKTDAATIAKLIKQLSSLDYTERDAASKALEAIGVPALEALRQAAKSNDAEVAQRAARLVGIIDNGFSQLLADYRGYGLPFPPEDAKLVRFKSGDPHFLGFLLSPGDKTNPARLLVGTQEYQLESDRPIAIVEPTGELVQRIAPHWYGSTFDMNAGLAIALQCQARGWHELAQKLWTVSLQQETGNDFGAFHQPANLPARTAVAYLAWAHYGNELVKPDTDRALIAKHLKSLLAAEPSLNTEIQQVLLKSLEAALVPSTAKPGSVESLIDDLTDICFISRRYSWGEPDPRYARLASMGFAAVPALIEHLDDDRLTRSIKQGFNNFPTWNLRVKHVVSDLLQELAGEELGKNWLQRQQGYGLEKADVQAWWDKAQKQGEEAYFLAHVFYEDERQARTSSLMLQIITARYPQHLPKLYQTILNDRPNIGSWPLAKAVSKSSLSVEQKRQLFLHASGHKDLEHRRAGLTHLQEIDPQQFMTILLATLEGLPKSPTEAYWSCPEASYAHLVLATDDSRAWKMLAMVAKRSDVGLRMELMNSMDYSDLGQRQRQQRLDFLAQFLDDAEAPDKRANPKMFEGPHAGFSFRRLEVRDLAAMSIASIIGLPDRPDREWTPEQWERLRTQVKQSLKR